MKVYAYVRVSTKEQDEEVQKKSIVEFCKSRNIVIVDFFVDKGESGAKPFGERPSSKLLLEQVKAEKVDGIVVWSIDRIGRTMLDTLSTIMYFESLGVRVISVKEEWLQTLDQNIRKLVLSILSWVAEFERRRIRERQIEAWSQGKQKGRPRKLKPETIEKYLKKYNTVPLKTILKIMSSEGLDVSYSTLRRETKRMGYVRINGKWEKIRSKE